MNLALSFVCFSACVSLPPPSSFFVTWFAVHTLWLMLFAQHSLFCWQKMKNVKANCERQTHRLTKAHIHTQLTVYFSAPLRRPCWRRFNCSSHTHTFNCEMRAWDTLVCFVQAQKALNDGTAAMITVGCHLKETKRSKLKWWKILDCSHW